MEILNKKQKAVVFVIVSLIVLFIAYYILQKTTNSETIFLEIENESDSYTEIEETKEIEKDEEINQIAIHIIGAIKQQGIVKVNKGSRISDVIEAAGGITDDADLSKINLAYMVEDGQKIYVPNINDKPEVENILEGAGENVIENGNQELGKVNINTASQTELETLNGIGPSTALKIINYRKENGEFKKVEDIKNVPGIGESKYDSLKDSICVK